MPLDPEEDLRRLRCVCALLRPGCESALEPAPAPETLRSERVALTIAVPELDAVSLWAVRRGDGMMSIPFVESILEQVQGSLERLGRAGGTRRPAQGMLPRLDDMFLPRAPLERLCRRGGVLDRVMERSEELVGLGRKGSIAIHA